MDSRPNVGVLRVLAAVAAWLITRVLMATLWATRESFIDHDVRYYYHQLTSKGLAGALVEYPTPIPAMLEAIRNLLAADEGSFVLVFVLVMASLDAWTTVWLWLRVHHWAAAYWTAFIAAIGSLVWFRIDLLPAVAVVLALGWVHRSPRLAGAAVAVGAALKLWPALLIAPMLGRGTMARRRGLGFLVMGGLLGLISLLWFGIDRSLSPLTWQSDRGLQIESIPATVVMLKHAFGTPGMYRTELSQYNAWEIYGPGTDTWQQVGDVLMVIAICFTILLCWLIAFNGFGIRNRTTQRSDSPAVLAARRHAIVLATTAIICAMIVANKTFSPQYMIWLAGPLAILVCLPLSGGDRRWSLVLAGLGLVCAFATHEVFPLNYSGLISEVAGPDETLLLAVRNGAVVVLTLLVGWRAVVAGWRLGALESPPPTGTGPIVAEGNQNDCTA